MTKNLYTEQEYKEWCKLLDKLSGAYGEEMEKAYKELKEWEIAVGMNDEMEMQMLNRLRTGE